MVGIGLQPLPTGRVVMHPGAAQRQPHALLEVTPLRCVPAGRPSRSHSTMSLSARPQRRVLVAKINMSQSFAGVNSTAERPFR